MKHMKSQHVLNVKNHKGFTLTEVVVSMFLFSLVGLIAISGIMFISKMSFLAHNAAEQEEGAQAMSLILQNYIGQAVNTDWTSSPINNIGAGRGKILNYSSDLNTSGNNKPDTVGLFLRENGYPTSKRPGSDIRATALYFRRPTPTQQGRLLVSTSITGYGNITLSSKQVQQNFGPIIELDIKPVGSGTDGEPVRVVEVSAVFRKFISGTRDQWRYCPSDEIAGNTACQSQATFKDNRYTVTIPLYNNTISSGFKNKDGTPYDQTLFGDMYFFHYARGM